MRTLLLDHYRTQLTKVPFGIAVLVSLAILFTPASGVPTAPPGTDKIVHFVLFAVLAITWRVARLPAALPGLVGYAVVSEILQSTLALGRSFELADIGVDALGLVTGLLIVTFVRRQVKSRNSF